MFLPYNYINQMPLEIKALIFQQLDPIDQMKAREVSREWNDILNDETLFDLKLREDKILLSFIRAAKELRYLIYKNFDSCTLPSFNIIMNKEGMITKLIDRSKLKLKSLKKGEEPIFVELERDGKKICPSIGFGNNKNSRRLNKKNDFTFPNKKQNKASETFAKIFSAFNKIKYAELRTKSYAEIMEYIYTENPELEKKKKYPSKMVDQ